MGETFIKVFEVGGYGLLSAAALAIVGTFFMRLFRSLLAENKAEREALRKDLLEERARTERLGDRYIASIDGIYAQMGDRHNSLLGALNAVNASLVGLTTKFDQRVAVAPTTPARPRKVVRKEN